MWDIEKKMNYKKRSIFYKRKEVMVTYVSLNDIANSLILTLNRR